MFSRQFDADPVLVPQPDGRTWKLHEEFTYTTDAGAVIHVPVGFITDLASVPRLLWWVVPPFGKYLPAALIHDKLYADHRAGLHHCSRAYCDAVLLEAMRDCGCSAWCANTIWIGVRLGGWVAWRISKPVS